MKLTCLYDKLIAAAKASPPSDRVPYAFEQRIMAQLRSHPIVDGLGHWAAALWRAAVPCVSLTAVLCVWAMLASGPAPTNDFSQEMENTVLAVVDHADLDGGGEIN